VRILLFTVGVLLGYIVYLSVALFTGELLENTIDLFVSYYPHWESYLYDLFNLHERMQTRRSRQSTLSKSGIPSQPLFDDENKNAIIVGADMGTLTHSMQETLASGGREDQGADFNMTPFRNTDV
jgi:hypothetical protein